jgi:hypothetical protein
MHSTVSNMGFIMCISGINSFGTLQYMRKAMPQMFKSFALGNLAEGLGLNYRKLRHNTMQFNRYSSWHTICPFKWMATI